jgi:hypothetical protein
MRGYCRSWSRSGEIQDEEVYLAQREEMSVLPFSSQAHFSEGMVGFSQFYFSSLGEADFATTELSPAADGLLFVGDVRLDNRQELHKKNEVMILRALEVNACRFSPSAMKAVSVMRE